MSCSSTRTLEPGATPKANWKRAADGIGMCVFATFLLLCTTGVLPWSFWMDAISLWPLLIMSAGIQIAFEKTRAPWLVLLGPLVVLAGLLWTATGVKPDIPPGLWKSAGPIARPSGAQRVKLDLNLVGSRLFVESRPIDNNSIVDARSVEEMLESRLKVDQKDDTAQIHLDTEKHRGFSFSPSRRQLWDLGIPSDLPARLALRGAMNRSRLDFSDGRFEGGTIDGAFLSTELTLPAVTETVKLAQKGAFNELRLIVPAGTPVTVKGAGFPINIVKRSVAGEPGRAGYEVTLDGAFTAIAIETVKVKTSPATPAEAAPTPAAPQPVPPTPEPSGHPKPAEPRKPASPAPNHS
jgi:hypothetical protein